MFPKATIGKLAKSVLQGDENESSMILSKDGLTAVQRSAVVFVSYLYHHAREVSKDQNRKTVNVQDILKALENTEFNALIPTVQEELISFNQRKEAKKLRSDKDKDQEVEEEGDDEKDEANKKLKVVEGAVDASSVYTSQGHSAGEAVEDEEATEDATEEVSEEVYNLVESSDEEVPEAPDVIDTIDRDPLNGLEEPSETNAEENLYEEDEQ
ncbi:BA75_05164T0 [Komagataella pastoris]|uniref:DNA polymerase epsilon subunit D n=1 Tax=Komagataella pastoris TaxID=4922 RepID=A0A1B2JIT8_PICPA|nr:BA75_05164T0 [Komagataella pastoris]